MLGSPFSGSPQEALQLLQGERAIFVRIYCLEDSCVSGLKLFQRNLPVTTAIHQKQKMMRRAGIIVAQWAQMGISGGHNKTGGCHKKDPQAVYAPGGLLSRCLNLGF